VCKSAIALYLSVSKRERVTEVLINPIIRTRTRHFRHAYPHSRDSILRKVGDCKARGRERLAKNGR
jgi:hypothetical protein